MLSSCGSKPSSTSGPTITVSCTPTDVTVLATSQCTATVINESSTLVNWSVSSTSGSGASQLGSITAGGLYTAPAAVPTNNVVTITATSQVSSTLTATQNLTIVAATQIAAVSCLNQSTQAASTVVSSGNSLECTATTSTGVTVPVNWTVANANKLGGNVGTISPSGVYTAPLVPPPGSSVAITATSQSLSSITMTVNVTVVFGSNVLSGNYVFSTTGRLTNKAFWARVGSFSAGGGSLSGIEDTNQGGAANTVTNRTFTGSYVIGSDGRGTMQFCEAAGQNALPPSSCPLGSGAATSFFRVVVVSPNQAQIIEFSPPQASSASLTAGGEMISQDPSIFAAGKQALSGVYSFTLSGVSSTGTDQSAVGDFAANGFGTISGGSAGNPGEIDLNPSATSNPATLPATAYSISSNGRGAVVLNGFSFVIYPVSTNRTKFIEVDPPPTPTSASPILVGDAYLQQLAPHCGWDQKALNGATVLETTGTASGIVTQDVGAFTASSTSVSGVSMDQNSGGMYTRPAGTSGDNYALDADGCGRGTLSLAGHSYVFYMIASSYAVLLETSPGVVAYGFLVPSQGGPFALATLTGSYAFRLGGTDAAGAAGDREDLVGQVTSAGSGTGLTGTLDQNDFGATTGAAGAAIAGGTYAAPGGLRATMSLPVATSPATTRNLVLYMVSPKLFYALDTDAAGTALGVLNDQF